jgi:hypothetical protein
MRALYKASMAMPWSTLVQKRCLQGILSEIKLSVDDFLAVFRFRGWNELWTCNELGWWFAWGLSQYGPRQLHSLIAEKFKDNREALLWLFLGGHSWYRPKASRRPDPSIRKGESDLCCREIKFRENETKYLQQQIELLSPEDKEWLLREIIRKAPEYGQCRDLGANIFNYLIVADLELVDVMLEIVLEEIIHSRLQFLFEFSISMALGDYCTRKAEQLAAKVNHSRKYKDKLMRPELELFSFL